MLSKEKHQKWFDTALTKLREQGHLSLGKDNKCRYRTNDICRCAVGWLIPDEAYDAASMEGKPVTYDEVWEAIPHATEPDVGFLHRLQRALHDVYHLRTHYEKNCELPYPNWLEGQAYDFAKIHGLTYTPPERASA